jgi:sugar lactone lactonase YvrE
MRHAHIGGDKLFVDYAGDTVPVIVDRLTGQVRPAQIKIHLPETCANLVFGGPLRNRLFVCGSTSVYALYVARRGR